MIVAYYYLTVLKHGAMEKRRNPTVDGFFEESDGDLFSLLR